MVEVCNEIHSDKGIRNKILKEEKPVTNFAFATVVTTKKIKKNEIFTKNNIWVKRPGTGKIPAKDLHKILKKKSKKILPKNYQLKYSDIKKWKK